MLTAPAGFEHRPARQQTALPPTGTRKRRHETLHPIPNRGLLHTKGQHLGADGPGRRLDFARISAIPALGSACVPQVPSWPCTAAGSSDRIVLLPWVISSYSRNVQSPNRVTGFGNTSNRALSGPQTREAARLSLLVYKELIPAVRRTVAFVQRLPPNRVNGSQNPLPGQPNRPGDSAFWQPIPVRRQKLNLYSPLRPASG